MLPAKRSSSAATLSRSLLRKRAQGPPWYSWNVEREPVWASALCEGNTDMADDAKSRDATITRLMVLSISAVDQLGGAPMLLAIAEQMNDALDNGSPSD